MVPEKAGEPPARVEGAAAHPPLWGARLFKILQAGFGGLDRLFAPVPASLNPLTQTGAVANVCLIIAVASGALLLFWYRASVNGAYSSLEEIRQIGIAQVLRSLHRYSSDACLFFVGLHALRSLAAQQVGGPRTLAWITGIVGLGLLWFVGWTGYWLVWDARAQAVAVGSAKLVDGLPIFIDPLSRSFLAGSLVNALLFFMVFFFHMLTPMAMAIALWLHIIRINKARFLTQWPLAAWILVSMIALSLLAPALSAGPADLARSAESFTMDWWYLAPLVLTDRLGTGALWAVTLGAGAFAMSAPWWLVRRGRARSRRPIAAEVDVPKCNACEKCFVDCPYDAITMVPRTDGRNFNAQAEVDPSKCVGCSICAGSCDSSGVGLPWIGAVAERARVDGWLAKRASGDPPHIAFVCAESAGATLEYDRATGVCDELPGVLVVGVPCAGWVHPLTLERAIRRGAAGALVVGCSDGGCLYRNGAEFAQARIGGKRAPALRTEKVEASKVQYLAFDRGQKKKLVSAVRAVRKGASQEALSRHKLMVRRAVAGAALVAGLGAFVYVPSDLRYRPPHDPSPKLVVSFKHPGKSSEKCHELSEEELANKPAHMRRPKVCKRRRAPVHMRILVDGQVRHERAHRPAGLFKDGNSIAVVTLDVAAGEHSVRVEIDDRDQPDAPAYVNDKQVTFEHGRREVLIFDRSAGFSWY